MSTEIGPDGRPAVFDGAGWVSSDGRYRWNGSTWAAVPRGSVFDNPWLMRLGIAMLFVAIAGFAFYSVVSSQDYFAAGYYVGLIVFFGLTIWLFRAAGNWGWFGILIRMATGGLMLLRILALIRNPPPT